jgi:hypothetical protein
MCLRARKFSIEPEIAMKAGRMRLRMLDIPIEYRPRIGQAKLSGIKAGLEDTVAIIRYLFWQPSRKLYEDGPELDGDHISGGATEAVNDGHSKE